MLTYMSDLWRNRLTLTNHIPPVAAVGDEAVETPAQATERRWRESEIRLAHRFTTETWLRVGLLIAVAGGLWLVARAVDSGLGAVERAIVTR